MSGAQTTSPAGRMGRWGSRRGWAPGLRVSPPQAPRCAGKDLERGAMALELAVTAPVFIVMLLLVVGFGRVSHGRQLVDQAAAAAARSAALSSTPVQAADAGRAAARSTLDQAGVSCRSIEVTLDVSAFRPGGQVAATVRCTADLSGLAVAGLPGSMTLEATARSPLELYRDLGT